MVDSSESALESGIVGLARAVPVRRVLVARYEHVRIPERDVGSLGLGSHRESLQHL